MVTSTTDTKAVACQVVQLFNAGGPENQNTVLLLLDNTSDEPMFEKNLEDNLIDEIKTSNVTATVPVVIILNCVCQLTARKSTTLCTSLSEEEKNKLKEKQAEVIQRHGDRHTTHLMLQRSVQFSFLLRRKRGPAKHHFSIFSTG